MSGCVIEDFQGPRVNSRPTSQRSTPRTYTSDGPNCADIIAAAGNPSDDKRVAPLKILAARPTLTTHEQIHLIDLTMECIGIDDKKAAVLEVLAQNPDLTADARMHLARRVRDLSNSAERVTAALLSNPPKATPTPPTPSPVPGPDSSDVTNAGVCGILGMTVTNDSKVIVVSVVENGAASQAGVKAGDVLIAINDWEISDFKSFRNGVRSEIVSKKAAELWIKAERSGARIAVNVVLPPPESK